MGAGSCTQIPVSGALLGSRNMWLNAQVLQMRGSGCLGRLIQIAGPGQSVAGHEPGQAGGCRGHLGRLAGAAAVRLLLSTQAILRTLKGLTEQGRLSETWGSGGCGSVQEPWKWAARCLHDGWASLPYRDLARRAAFMAVHSVSIMQAWSTLRSGSMVLQMVLKRGPMAWGPVTWQCCGLAAPAELCQHVVSCSHAAAAWLLQPQPSSTPVHSCL